MNIDELGQSITRAKTASVLGSAAHGLGHLAAGAVHAGAEIGGGLIGGLGGNPAIGRLIGGAVPVLAGAEAARRGKQRFDMWRLQNGLMDPNAFYGGY